MFIVLPVVWDIFAVVAFFEEEEKHVMEGWW